MSLSARMNLKQSQSLTMTPQLMQSIRLLQYTPLELSQFIDEQIQSNPLLVLANKDEDPPVQMDDQVQSLDDNLVDLNEVSLMADGDISQVKNMENVLDVNMRNVFPDDEIASKSNSELRNRDDYSVGPSGELHVSGASIDLDSFSASAPGMREAMSEQIALEFKSERERLIAVELIDYLDDAGYFDGHLSEIASRFAVELTQVEHILARVQQFDPPGIFARNLGECLSVQLRRQKKFHPAMESLIENLELLARKDFVSLCKICDVDEQKILEMVADIQSLDPKPGTSFVTQGVQTVIPEILLKKLDDGDWQVEINSQTLPHILVDQSYFSTITKGVDKTSADYKFMNECLQSANWLSRSLDQRAQTIIKVATEIVKHQQEFFDKGVQHLKPLNLKTIAEAVGMHESTISRVTSNKYIMTPRGLFELKYFFTVSIGGVDGLNNHSAESIRQRIKVLIDGEDVKNVLSDDNIVLLLKRENIEIARRTVAKYRESLNIASSVQRRREKKILMRVGT
jgi:RNA polymerase sigma-54 factor